MRAPPSPVTGPAPGEGMAEIDSIDPGERAGRDLGDLGELMASIALNGLDHDITVTPGRRLVLGYRRWEACRRLGRRHIEATAVTTVQEALDRIDRDAQGARCVHELTIIERMNMDFAVRELKWWPRDGSTVPANHHGRRDGRREDIARHYGLNGRQYSIARMLACASRGYSEYLGTRKPVSADERELATAALRMVRKPPDLHAARRMYLEVQDYEPHPATGPRRTPTRKQEERVGEGLATLSGLITGFSSLTTLDPAIPADVLDRWDRDLGDAIRELANFRRKVQRHGHGGND